MEMGQGPTDSVVEMKMPQPSLVSLKSHPKLSFSQTYYTPDRN